MQKTISKFLTCSGEKSKEVKEIEKAEKSKYEINTNLSLARARRLKSDMHDFSSAFLPLVGLSWRIGRSRTLDLPPHLLCSPLSSRRGGSMFWLG
jgi:hypothetical protein